MNGAFLRMIAHVPAVVKAASRCPPAALVPAFNSEVSQLAMDNLEFGRCTEEQLIAQAADPEKAKKAEIRRQSAAAKRSEMWERLKVFFPQNKQTLKATAATTTPIT